MRGTASQTKTVSSESSLSPLCVSQACFSLPPLNSIFGSAVCICRLGGKIDFIKMNAKCWPPTFSMPIVREYGYHGSGVRDSSGIFDLVARTAEYLHIFMFGESPSSPSEVVSQSGVCIVIGPLFSSGSHSAPLPPPLRQDTAHNHGTLRTCLVQIAVPILH